MPRVPTYDGPQLASAPLRPAFQSAPDVSSGAQQLARGVGQVGDEINKVVVKQAETEGWTAQAQLADEFDKWDTAERAKSQGANASGYRARAEAWWADAKEKYAGALSPMAKQSIDRSLATMRNSTLKSASDFEFQQTELGQKSALAASANGLVKAAIKAGPDAAEPVLAEATNQIKSFYKSRGQDGTAEALRYTSAAYTTIINEMALRDPKDALRYFNQVKDGGIDPTLWDNIGAKLNQSSGAADGDAEAQRVWTSLGPKTYSDAVRLDSMEAEARKTYANDPVRRESAIAGLRQRAQAHNSTQAEIAAQGSISAWATYNKTGSLAAMMKDPGWGLIPAPQQAELKNRVISMQTAALERDEAAIRRNEAQTMRSYSAAYHAYMDPAVLAKQPRSLIQAMEPTLGRQYTNQLLEKYDSIQKSPAVLADAKVDHDDMMSVMQEMGLKPFEKNKSEDGKALIGVVQSRAERALTQFQNATKTPLTREQKNKFLREEIARQVSVQTSFLGISTGADTVPVAELTADQLSKVIIPPDHLRDVVIDGQPRKDIRSEMADLYRRSGGTLTQYEPTEENLRRFYLQYRVGSATAGMIPNKRGK